MNTEELIIAFKEAIIGRISGLVPNLFPHQEKDLGEFIDKIITPLETQIRLETLKEVLPEENKEYQESIEAGVCFSARGFNQCRQEIINKAKEIWNIEL